MAVCVVVPPEHPRKGLLESCSEESLRDMNLSGVREGGSSSCLQGREGKWLQSYPEQAEPRWFPQVAGSSCSRTLEPRPSLKLCCISWSHPAPGSLGGGWEMAFIGFCCPTPTSEEGTGSCLAAAPEGLMGQFQLVPVSTGVEGAGRCGWELSLSLPSSTF